MERVTDVTGQERLGQSAWRGPRTSCSSETESRKTQHVERFSVGGGGAAPSDFKEFAYLTDKQSGESDLIKGSWRLSGGAEECSGCGCLIFGVVEGER